jgi:hypothetical protein
MIGLVVQITVQFVAHMDWFVIMEKIRMERNIAFANLMVDHFQKILRLKINTYYFLLKLSFTLRVLNHRIVRQTWIVMQEIAVYVRINPIDWIYINPTIKSVA